MNALRLVRKFSEAPGPSGYEHPTAAVIEEAWRPLVDELRIDRVGNLVAIKRGQGAAEPRRLLLAAHMDEIALMVKAIVSHAGNGFLRVTGVGGVDRRQVYGQLVAVHGTETLHGVVGGPPRHMLDPDRASKAYSYEDLVVDVGLPAERLRELVSVGDFVTFRQPVRELLNKRVAGKSFDNRASVAAVTVALDYLQSREHSWDVIAVATIQEEVGLKGARVTGFAETPDVAVAIDVTHGKGPGAKDSGTVDIGGGPTLDLGPNVHPGMYRALKEAADALEMKIQVGTHSRASGTDAYALQIARAGIPTGLVSLPLRYMHTMVETLALKDVKRTGRLLGEFAARLEEDFLDQLAESMLKAD